MLKSMSIVFLLFALFSVTVYAEINQDTVNFQGYLTKSDGEPVTDGSYPMTVSLWDGPVDDTANKVWEESHTPTVVRGIYSIELGSSVSFPYTLSFAQQYYLGVSVSGESLDQLIPLTNTWSAFRAKTSGGRLIKEISSNYTVEDTDDIILASGNITLTMPEASTVPNRIFTIKKMDATNALTIATNASETIDGVNRGSGGTALDVSNQYDEISVISDGQNWVSMGITYGIVSHEKGGLETDVSDFDGLVKISGGSTSSLTITSAGEALLDDSDISSQRATLELTPGEGLEIDSGSLRISSDAAGDGLEGGGGSELAVRVDDSTIELFNDILRLKDTGITDAKINDVAASKISGTLSHENGGLEADISAYEGLLKISSGSTSQVTLGSAAEDLLDDSSVSDQRTTLGLGSIATQDSTSVDIDGGAIDDTSIGIASPQAGKFTDLTTTGTTDIEGAAITLGKDGTAAPGQIILHDNQSSDDFKTIIQSADSVSANVTFTLPSADGTANQVLQTDGSGNLSWVDTFGGSTQMIAGDGLTGGGDLSADRTFNVNVDDSTIEISSDAIQVKDSGITDAKISGVAASKITGTLTHESGGMEADISSYEGLLKISGGTTSQVTLSTAAEGLLDDSSDSEQRSTLGLGSIATQEDSNVDINGGNIDGTTIGNGSPANGYFSDLVADTDLLYVDSTSDEVGISTTTPNSKLDVNGTVTATGIDLNGSMEVSNYIYFGGQNTTGTWRLVIDNDHFEFQRFNGTSWDVKFEITD